MKHNTIVILALGLLLPLAAPVAAAQPQSNLTGRHVVFVIWEDEYKADQTLPAFARLLTDRYGCRCSVLVGGEKGIEGLGALKTADAMVLFVRRKALPTEQLDAIRAYLDAGKPLVALRTSCHAFAVNNSPPGSQQWPAFDTEVLGCHYTGHLQNEAGTEVANSPDAAGEPLLAGVEPARWHSDGSLYKVRPLAAGCKVLMTGRVGKRVEPVAWTRTYKGGRVFSTTLGHPHDFALPQFQKLLSSAISWATDSGPARGKGRGGITAERDEYKPTTSLKAALAKGLRPGTIVDVDDRDGPLVEDLSLDNLRGEPGKPIVIRGTGGRRAVIRGRLKLTGAAYVVLKSLAFEPAVADASADPWLSVEGEHVEINDCSITVSPGDGLRLAGAHNSIISGEVAACEGCGVVLTGSARVNGLRVVSCRKGGIHAGGDALVSNCLLLHNRGPAVEAIAGTSLRFYHNLVYDNGGGLILDECAGARVLNNIFVNNYASPLLGEQDVEISANETACIDHNIYFRHPGKDKLLRGLPYAQGVDLTPLAADNPFGLRLRLGGKLVTSLAQKSWAEKFDQHSQCLDILQRFTGSNSYTRSYEDLFVEFQQEDFRPRFSSPAVGQGTDLTAEVAADVAGRPRSAAHPDIGPFAAPADWWRDIDSHRATIVDGNAGLDAAGRDCGLGTVERPFATLAKAAAFARWGSRIYVKDSIYRHSGVQTTFALGPDSVLSGFPGHRPAFSPSESIEPGRWEKLPLAGVYRIRDWHTFLGYNHRANCWAEDYYGNMRLGGREANVTSLSRNSARLADPFRPIRYLYLDRDTPQVLCDGVALQQAGGVLGMEELSIGTMSAWGRDPSHLRPGSFIVGRRDFLMSRAVGKDPLQDGQQCLAGPNRDPEMMYRIDGHSTGFVSEFVARPARAWRSLHGYAGGDRLWELDPAATAAMGKLETRLLKDGWRQVLSGKDSACWVRQFALPVHELLGADGAPLERHEAQLGREQLPVRGWLQRQYQTGDAALQAVLDNPFEDYLEVRLPAGVDPNQDGLRARYFSGRVEAVWRKAAAGEYSPGVNSPGLAMMSSFRTMEVGPTPEATAATATENWQFGFLVPLGQSVPVLLMRMPGDVDPNAEDPWKFTVVDDCLYVFLPKGESPAAHAIEAACNSDNYTAGVGGNSSFSDWQDAGLLRPDWPAIRVYRTEMDFDGGPTDPLWGEGGPTVQTEGFEIDPGDPSGKTLHLLDGVRLDAGDPPGQVGEKVLIVRYVEGNPAAPVRREHRVNSKQLGADRRIVLPSPPVAFDPRGALLIAPADHPERGIEQQLGIRLRQVASRGEMGQGTYCYDPRAHALYVCLLPGSEPWVNGWGSGPRTAPTHLVRGLYAVGGNAYGHQKQYCWGTGLGVVGDVFEDVSVGFSTGHNLNVAPGGIVRDCTFRWAGADVGMGGQISGFERHTADRLKRPELRVDHCTFDCSNSFLFDGNDNPTKNIPFANHQIWENSYFLAETAGLQGPWWDEHSYNNVVQNCVFTGRAGVDVEISAGLIARNNLFCNDKASCVTFRGSDKGHVLNNTTFRGGGIWFHSEPERCNATNWHGTPCYGPSFPMTERGQVPWLSHGDPTGQGVGLGVRWLPLADRPEVFYCENWDLPSPLLIDAKAFASYRSVGSVAELARGTYFHDVGARRLYLCQTDGSPPGSMSLPTPPIPQAEPIRRDLIYTLTVVRPGRLSLPYRALGKTEFEILEPPPADQSIEITYYDARGRRAERFPVTAAMISTGRPRLRLAGKPADERLFIGLAGERPPLVRVTGSGSDVRPFEAELLPGSSIIASPTMGMQFNVLRGHFATVKAGDQFESVFHSTSVCHFSSLDNLFLDLRSHDASDATGSPYHGFNYLVMSEHEDASHSRIDYNCYWKDLHAVPGPLSAFVQWGKELVNNSTAAKEGISLRELFAKTGYERHGLSPGSYFTLVANPLRFDFRPLPDSPLIGAGTVSRQQVGDFLFDPDQGNGRQRFTFKGNEFDIAGHPRGARPTIGACQDPLPGARAFYVGPTGRDAPQGGTRAAPWATADYAIARMRPGDLLVLLAGTYRQPIVIRRSGTARDFLHVVAENPPYPAPAKFATGGPTVLDASAMGDTPAVLLDGCAHVRVAGLRVVGSKADAAVELRNTRDCVLEYVFVEHSPGDGAGIRATGRGNTLYECSVTGGNNGYELAGSLTDVRWCAAEKTIVGFRAVGPTAGLHLLQNRHLGGGALGFGLTHSSDLVLDGNWAEAEEVAYVLGGERIMLVNNNADAPRNGITALGGADFRILNNTLLRCGDDGLQLGDGVRSALVLNNVLQAEGRQADVMDGQPPGGVWLDYNLCSRASLPFRFAANVGGRTFTDLAAWTRATGMDRNSRVAPLIYSKLQDRNGRWRVRENSIAVTNFTPDFNAGPLGVNAYPYTGGGTYILDVPQNWKPAGDPARRVYVLDTQPDGALAARAWWYVAHVDYRRPDGSRAARDMYRVDQPPERMPAGSFCWDAHTGRVFVRMPADARDPCPIGTHRKLTPRAAIGDYVGREATGAAEKYRGKLVTAGLAKTMNDEGIKEIDTVANFLSCLFGTPTLERGCPIQGLYRDADSQPRPSVPLSMVPFGSHAGPGRYDIGAWEHGYYAP